MNWAGGSVRVEECKQLIDDELLSDVSECA